MLVEFSNIHLLLSQDGMTVIIATVSYISNYTAVFVGTKDKYIHNCVID